jgi:hypothetical protein
MRDVNLEVASALYDMAAVARDSQRAFGYKRAAKAVLRIDRDITPLITSNTFKSVPGIGPTTDRIARELVLDGHSPFVERAIAESGKVDEIARLHNTRCNYLSRAAVADIVSRKGAPSKAKYRGDYRCTPSGATARRRSTRSSLNVSHAGGTAPASPIIRTGCRSPAA